MFLDGADNGKAGGGQKEANVVLVMKMVQLFYALLMSSTTSIDGFLFAQYLELLNIVI